MKTTFHPTIRHVYLQSLFSLGDDETKRTIVQKLFKARRTCGQISKILGIQLEIVWGYLGITEHLLPVLLEQHWNTSSMILYVLSTQKHEDQMELWLMLDSIPVPNKIGVLMGTILHMRGMEALQNLERPRKKIRKNPILS